MAGAVLRPLFCRSRCGSRPELARQWRDSFDSGGFENSLNDQVIRARFAFVHTPYWRSLLGEAALEDRAQTRLPGVSREGFFHLQYSVPIAKFEGRDVVLEPRFFMHQVPADS